MTVEAPVQQKKNWLIAVLRLYLTIALPVLLTVANVRLIMMPAFLSFEYNRADFPVDVYGLTTQDRLNYAPYAITYLLNGEDISYLGNLQFPEGTPMYNDQELHHMSDVKNVVQMTFLIAVIGGILAAVIVFVLWRQSRSDLRRSLRDGSLLTIGIVVTIVILAVTSWDVFFTNFHNLFFAQGTWVFLYSDTLIRLFPEQFWFDAALLIGSLTTFEAFIIFVSSWRWRLP
jgi:integral membrane protein (TIGR01906 family)